MIRKLRSQFLILILVRCYFIQIEFQLLALQQVTISSTTLSRSGKEDGQQTSSVKLFLQSRVDIDSLLMLGLLFIKCLLDFFANTSSSLAQFTLLSQRHQVVVFVPLAKKSSIDYDDNFFTSVLVQISH